MELSDWLKESTYSLLEEASNSGKVTIQASQVEYTVTLDGGAKTGLNGIHLEIKDPDLHSALARLCAELTEREQA